MDYKILYSQRRYTLLHTIPINFLKIVFEIISENYSKYVFLI